MEEYCSESSNIDHKIAALAGGRQKVSNCLIIPNKIGLTK